MTHTGDGSAPRRSVGGILSGRDGDRIWVGEYERGWRICLAGSWIDGFYASEETARRALGLSAYELKALYPIWTRDGEDRPVTWDDLDRLERARPARPLLGFVCGLAVPVVAGGGVAGLLGAPATWPEFVVFAVGAAAFFGGGALVDQYVRAVEHPSIGAARGASTQHPWDALRPKVVLGLARHAKVPAALAIAGIVASFAVLVAGITFGVLAA